MGELGAGPGQAVTAGRRRHEAATSVHDSSVEQRREGSERASKRQWDFVQASVFFILLQVWSEEMALVENCLKHLKVQQSKILRAMVSRQSYTLDR